MISLWKNHSFLVKLIFILLIAALLGVLLWIFDALVKNLFERDEGLAAAIGIILSCVGLVSSRYFYIVGRCPTYLGGASRDEDPGGYWINLVLYIVASAIGLIVFGSALFRE